MAWRRCRRSAPRPAARLRQGELSRPRFLFLQRWRREGRAGVGCLCPGSRPGAGREKCGLSGGRGGLGAEVGAAILAAGQWEAALGGCTDPRRFTSTKFWNFERACSWRVCVRVYLWRRYTRGRRASWDLCFFFFLKAEAQCSTRAVQQRFLTKICV